MAIPIGAVMGVAQGLGGLAQTIFGGGAARKAQRDMEKMVNEYKPNASINDFYNKALSRYNPNAYESSMYRNQMQNVNRNMATGISALQDRRSGLAGIAGLVQGTNDASLRASASAEQQQAQALGQLGQATGMKADEDRRGFDMKYNLLAMKAGGANQIVNSGLSNIFGGLGTVANTFMAKDMYGTGGGASGQQQQKSYGQIGTNSNGSPHFGYR
jgi:hypothetical protein